MIIIETKMAKVSAGSESCFPVKISELVKEKSYCRSCMIHVRDSVKLNKYIIEKRSHIRSISHMYVVVSKIDLQHSDAFKRSGRRWKVNSEKDLGWWSRVNVKSG